MSTTDASRAITTLWRRLQAVRALEFVLQAKINDGVVKGRGRGIVAVAGGDDDQTLLFAEQGVWTLEAGQPLDFTNTYRWSLREETNTIRLEHLRYGPDQPIYLLDLTPRDDDTYQTITPHLCGADVYRAALAINAGVIDLWWFIKGPAKDSEIHYRYTYNKS